MTSPYADEQPMPATATRNLFLWASGFGICALLVLFGFIFLIGIGQVGHETVSGPSPAAQSAATAPAAPGPAPQPAPQTSGPPETTGQAPQPAQADTKQKAQQPAETTGQAPKAEPADKAPTRPQVPKPGANSS
jgi:hypothetical protein